MNKSPFTLEDFAVGQNVNVESLPGDLFESFTGHVKEVNNRYIIVEDQAGDCFDCEPSQLTFSSDDIMHGA
jgi:hypothetical protein